MNRHCFQFATIGLALVAYLLGCSAPTPVIIVVTATPEGKTSLLEPTAVPTAVQPTVARPEALGTATRTPRVIPTAVRPTQVRVTLAPTVPRPTGKATSTRTPTSTATPIPTAGTLTPLDTPSGDAIAVLVDVSGTVLNFKTFDVLLTEGTGNLRYDASTLDGIYRSKAIPLHQSNVTTFTAIDQISEFHRVGDAVTLVLINGERIAGVPLTESSFSGESTLGKISLPAQKAQSIKFSVGQVKRSLQGKPAVAGSVNWPAKFTSRADVTLNTGNTIALRNIALVYVESGCSTMWIPCKAWSNWNLAQSLPIKYGEYSTQLDLSKIESMDVNAPKADTVDMNITLRSGEKLDAVLDYPKAFRGVAMLGTTANGFVHMPLHTIKSMVFASQ